MASVEGIIKTLGRSPAAIKRAEKLAEEALKAAKKAGGWAYRAGISSKPKTKSWRANRNELLKDRNAFVRNNPLVSPKKGSLSFTRTLGGLAGLGGLVSGGKYLMGQGNQSGLTDAQIAALNAGNAKGTLDYYKSLYNYTPADYSAERNYTNELMAAAQGLPQVNIGGAGNTLGGQTQAAYDAAAQGINNYNTTSYAGTDNLTPVSGQAAGAADYLRGSGTNQEAAVQGGAKSGDTTGGLNASSKAYIDTLGARIQAAQMQSEIADTRTRKANAATNWQDFLVKNPDLVSPAGLSSAVTPFTGQEAQLTDVYNEWIKLTPEQLQTLHRKGIYTPSDLYNDMLSKSAGNANG